MKLARAFGITLLLLTFAPLATAREAHMNCPMMQDQKKTKEPSAAVKEHGDAAMGFDQDKTTHHFFLKGDGGVIQVTANDVSDNASREMIQSHLAHIAAAFAQGDFNIPMLVHDRVPPGVPEMKRLKGKIQYRYEALEQGGRVVIYTSDARALAAIHKFLRFQIQDHATGDSLKVQDSTVEGIGR
jgi:hypothetical protein